MKKFFLFLVVIIFASCGYNDYSKSHMEALGVQMGITSDEYVNRLIERDSAWNYIVKEETYSEEDTCYLRSLIHEPEYKDSCAIVMCLIIHSSPKTKTVFYIEMMTMFNYDGKSISNDHIPVTFYYASVYGLSMLYEEYPNSKPMTTRYANNNYEILVKDATTGKFKKEVEDYNILENKYQAMWQWKYGECFITLDCFEEPVISTNYIDYQGVEMYEKEKQNPY